MTASRIIVCVPTYRRPEKLAALLKALAAQDIEEPFSVIVGNNDATSPTELIGVSGAIDHLEEIAVAERGVSAVRNAMMQTVLAKYPAAEWIACIDDDELPSNDWLARLVAAGRRFNADLVGGPVHQIPAVSTFWAQAATATDYLPSVEGPTPILNGTGNLLISSAFVRSLERPPFDAAFGKTGGEDYEFFLRAKKAGARIFWTPNACVTEVIPPARLTLRGLVHRSYTASASQTRADLMHGSPVKLVLKIGRNVLALPVAISRSFGRRRSISFAVALLVQRCAGICGSVAGMAGSKIERYGEHESEDV